MVDNNLNLDMTKSYAELKNQLVTFFTKKLTKASPDDIDKLADEALLHIYGITNNIKN